MRIILMLIFVFGGGILYAQGYKTPFSVRYLSGYIEPQDSLHISRFIKKHPFHPMPNYELVVADTVAYIHLYIKERERNENPLGSSFRPLNLYIDFKSQKEFRQSDPWNSGRYQVEASYQTQQFDLLKDSIQILGYTCYKAVPVNQTSGFHTFFWYTPALPHSLSMYGFTGLPGLVLAYENWHPKFRQVTIAERIEPEKRKLIKPKKGTPIGALEYEKLLIEIRNRVFNRL